MMALPFIILWLLVRVLPPWEEGPGRVAQA
jgi:hypothetical protein